MTGIYTSTYRVSNEGYQYVLLRYWEVIGRTTSVGETIAFSLPMVYLPLTSLQAQPPLRCTLLPPRPQFLPLGTAGIQTQGHSC